MSLKQRHTRSQRTTSVVSNTLIHPVTLFDFVMWQVVREHCAPAERRWPESRLQVPGVTHELPPVHRGVVDAVIFVLVCGALVMQGRGALLAWPSCEDPRGEEGWGHTGRKEGSKVAALHAQLPQIFHCTHLLVEHKLSVIWYTCSHSNDLLSYFNESKGSEASLLSSLWAAQPTVLSQSFIRCKNARLHSESVLICSLPTIRNPLTCGLCSAA